jgi:hypothetical protein
MPMGSETIGNVVFSINGSAKRYDGIVVLQSTRRYEYEELCCKEGNALLVVMEPQDILRMPSGYTNQFDHVLTPNCKVRGKHIIHSQFGQLWTFNQDYESMILKRPPDKTLNFSTVTSIKTDTNGQRRRIELLRRIQEEIGIDWYGRGVSEIEDKWDAIAPYKYHLVFENGRWPHYWTEKLTDAFLGFSLPIYVGCPNIKEYFSQEALILLDDTSPQKAVNQLIKLVEDDAYSIAFQSIVSARNKVIYEYSLFNVLIKLIQQYFSMSTTSYKRIDLRLFENISYKYSIRKMLKRSLRNLINMR